MSATTSGNRIMIDRTNRRSVGARPVRIPTITDAGANHDFVCNSCVIVPGKIEIGREFGDQRFGS